MHIPLGSLDDEADDSFGVRVLGAETFRCGKDIVINDI